MIRRWSSYPRDRFASAAEFGTALGDESFTYRARPTSDATTRLNAAREVGT